MTSDSEIPTQRAEGHTHVGRAEDEAAYRKAQKEILLDLSEVPADRAEGLRLLHAKYTQMYLSDNNRIWTTAATMIPLSLSAFAVLVSIDEPTLFQVGALATASWTLMALWFIIAENHRTFKETSLTKTKVIETLWGLRPPAGPEQRPRRLFTGRGGVRRTRIALLWGVTVGWIAVLLWWPSTFLYRFVERLLAVLM